MRTHLRALFFLLLPFLTFAQKDIPTIIQNHIYGGGSSERFYAIKATSDGGFIAAGNTNSWIGDGDIDDVFRRALGQLFVDPNNDSWIIKLDANYKIQWQRVLGGNNFDGALALQQAPDGSFVVAGYWESSGGDNSGVHPSHNGGVTRDGFVLKLNSDGSTAWIKLMGGGGDDEFDQVQITSDGGILLCGLTNSNDGDIPANLYHDHPFDNNFADAWLVKLDSKGNLMWQKIMGGENKDAFTGMDKTNDGNYILGGFTNSVTGDLTNLRSGYNREAWIVKITPDGNVLWQNFAAKANNIETRPYSIVTARNGDFYLGGPSAQDYSSTMDFFVCKFSSGGAFKWYKIFGGSGDDWARTVTRSSQDDGVFIAGYTLTENNGDVSGYHGGRDAWIVHCDAEGNAIHKICIGGNDYDYFWNSTNTSDGRALFAGYSKSRDGDMFGIPRHGDLDGWIVELNWGKSTPIPCSNDTQRITRNVCLLNQVFNDTVGTTRSDGCQSIFITQRVISKVRDTSRVADILCNPIINKTTDTLNFKSYNGCDSTVIVSHTIKRTGDKCDDGNPNTINDVLQADCTCKGERNPNGPSADLSVSVSASPNNYRNFSNNTFTVTVKNMGVTDFTNVIINFPFPKATVHGGDPTVTKGEWFEYCQGGVCYEWRLPILKAGDSAVFTHPLFVLIPDGKIVATATLKSSVPEDVFTENNSSSFTLLPAPSILNDNSHAVSGLKSQAFSFKKVFPQPITDVFYVEMLTKAQAPIVFSLTDVTGRILWTETQIANGTDAEFEFSLKNEPSGMYILQAINAEGVITNDKLIKN